MISIDGRGNEDEIISRLAKNDLSAWEYIYDKYSPALYGKIYRMAGNKAIADEILITAFVKFREKKVFPHAMNLLLASLFKHTHNVAVQVMKTKGLSPSEGNNSQPIYPLMDRLLFSGSSGEDLTIVTGTGKDGIRRKLREEMNSLRWQVENKQPLSGTGHISL